MEATTLQLLTGLGGTVLGGIVSLATTWFLNHQQEAKRERKELLESYTQWAASIENMLSAQF